MKIVFMGTPQAAALSLDRLIDRGHEIRGVYTQPDRPSGRGKKIVFSPVKELAVTHKMAVFQPSKIKTSEVIDEFRSLEADVAVVVAYGRILPEPFLSAFPNGAINVHFSLLPKYRGAAPVNWAIVNGESETGVTTMKMDNGLDTGDILLQRATAIGTNETAVELMERLADVGADLLIETLANIDSITPLEQNEDNASLAPILKKDDGLIDWKLSAEDIALRVRGFQPFPTSYTFHEGQRLTVWSVIAVDRNESANAGTIIEATGDDLVVSCGNNTGVLINEIQPEGKRRMTVRDFLNGTRLKIGDRLSSIRSEAEAANQ